MAAQSWLYWALASAVFAAMTAIFAKLGLQGVDSDFATFIRTLVIIAALSAFLTYAKKWQPLGSLSAKNWLFLILSGLATGASWLAYFKALQMGDASQVAPIAGGGVCGDVFGGTPERADLAGDCAGGGGGVGVGG